MQLPVTIRLERSRRLVAVQVTAHALAVAVVLPLMLPWPVRCALFVAIVASLLLFLRRTWRMPVTALHLGAKGTLEIDPRVGPREPATILPETAMLPGLVLLSLRTAAGCLRLPLPPDTMDPAAYRRLRVWLRWRAAVE